MIAGSVEISEDEAGLTIVWLKTSIGCFFSGLRKALDMKMCYSYCLE